MRETERERIAFKAQSTTMFKERERVKQVIRTTKSTEEREIKNGVGGVKGGGGEAENTLRNGLADRGAACIS